MLKMKRIICLLLVLCCVASFCTCRSSAAPVVCIHKWKNATYTEPKKCEKCGATEGLPMLLDKNAKEVSTIESLPNTSQFIKESPIDEKPPETIGEMIMMVHCLTSDYTLSVLENREFSTDEEKLACLTMYTPLLYDSHIIAFPSSYNDDSNYWYCVTVIGDGHVLFIGYLPNSDCATYIEDTISSQEDIDSIMEKCGTQLGSHQTVTHEIYVEALNGIGWLK